MRSPHTVGNEKLVALLGVNDMIIIDTDEVLGDNKVTMGATNQTQSRSK